MNFKAKPNYIYSIIGVSLALILLGMFAGTIVFFSQMIRNVTLYREVIVEVTEDDPDLVRQLENMIKAGPYARPGTVRFISSEEAARSLMEDGATTRLSKNCPVYFLMYSISLCLKNI